MKARRSNRKITPFGGVVPVLKQIRDFKIPELIRECLGVRVKQAKYSYEDILIAWMLTNYCGGYRLDHITKLRKNLDIIPGLNLPSHDTLGRVLKSLANETEISIRKGHSSNRKKEIKNKTYNYTAERELNINMPLSKLLIRILRETRQLKPSKAYTLDVDATLIPTECYDAKFSYKQKHGYSPMISSIGQLPVFIETRNGNVAPATRIKENIEISIGLLKAQGITIDKVRMDSAGYSKEPMDYMQEIGVKFYISGKKKEGLMKAIQADIEWKPFQLETLQSFWVCECSETKYRLTGGKHDYRVIVLRVPKDKKTPAKWIQGENFHYKTVITNDWNSTPEEIVKFLNGRGASERLIDTLKNNHGFRLPPFSFMNQNAVFLIVCAIANVVYQAIVAKVSKHVDELKPESRLKEFIFIFMTVALELIDEEAVFYDTKIPYEKFC